VLANREPHLAYQMRLESEGVLFAAGPLAGEDGETWDGSGAFVYRAPSLDRAREIAEADPMHMARARRPRNIPWLTNEGSVSFGCTSPGRRRGWSHDRATPSG
jgi:hypothetical protein